MTDMTDIFITLITLLTLPYVRIREKQVSEMPISIRQDRTSKPRKVVKYDYPAPSPNVRIP